MSLKIYNQLHSVVRGDLGFVEKWIDYFFKSYPITVQNKIKSGVCLDAGCGGTVKGVELIKKFGPNKVYACDINEDHEGFYKKVGVQFVHGDIASLPFENEFFDFILCNGVAHHTPDPWKSISELCRVLKPGGVLHISVYCFKWYPFHWLVLLLRALAILVPFRLAKSLCGNQFSLNVLLDHAYVPHEFIYTKKEFAEGLHKRGIDVDLFLNPSESYSKDNSAKGFLAANEGLLFGDGAILSFIGSKKTNGASTESVGKKRTT